MPNRRSKRKKTQHFFCPYCSRRLWRQGSKKYYLAYTEASEIREHFQVSRKQAHLLAATGKGYVDSNAWIEEFFCEQHGTLWMVVNKEVDLTLGARVAKDTDWSRTTHTIDPEISNPSVSEYTRRMSRKAYLTMK